MIRYPGASSRIGTSRETGFYDLNNVDAAELAAGAVGVVAVAFCWKRTGAETFARLMGISATIGANPLIDRHGRRDGPGLSEGSADRAVGAKRT